MYLKFKQCKFSTKRKHISEELVHTRVCTILLLSGGTNSLILNVYPLPPPPPFKIWRLFSYLPTFTILQVTEYPCCQPASTLVALIYQDALSYLLSLDATLDT